MAADWSSYYNAWMDDRNPGSILSTDPNWREPTPTQYAGGTYGGPTRWDDAQFGGADLGYLTGLNPASGTWDRLYGATDPGGFTDAQPDGGVSSTPWSFEPTPYDQMGVRGKGTGPKTLFEKYAPTAIKMGTGALFGVGALGALGAAGAGAGSASGLGAESLAAAGASPEVAAATYGGSGIGATGAAAPALGGFESLAADGGNFVGDLPMDGDPFYGGEIGGDFVGDLPMADDAFYGDYGGLDQYAGDAEGMYPGEPSGMSGGPTGTADPGVLDKLGSWAKENPFLARAGLGAGVAGLQMLGARSVAKKNAAISGQQLEAQRARQALMDNPPAYSSMNIQRPGQKMDFAQTAVMNPQALRTYGQRPEQRFFNARGGLPAQSDKLGAFDKYVGGHGGGQDDNVPAMLSPKEYVIDADVVAALGDGNPDHGARKLDAFRERVRSHKRGAPTGKIPPKARSIDSYMGRA